MNFLNDEQRVEKQQKRENKKLSFFISDLTKVPICDRIIS